MRHDAVVRGKSNIPIGIPDTRPSVDIDPLVMTKLDD